MKTLAEIDKTLGEFEKRFGLLVRGAQQRSEPWFNMKLGVVSASNASKAVAGKNTETRATYMAHLVAQVCTGVIEEMSFKQTEWGNQHEDAARSAREFESGEKITPLCFVFKDDTFRVGCSPDGVSTFAPEEIKCPWDSANYVKFLIEGAQKPEWVWQNQATLWIMGADEMNVTQYDPRMKTRPFHTITVERDAEKIKKLDELVPEFLHDMDLILAKLGIKFGDHWLRKAASASTGEGEEIGA